jgi:hypothetical protein
MSPNVASLAGGESDAPPGHVFLSYVREDSAPVDQLQNRLEAAGLRVWRDLRDIAPGEAWQARLRHAIGADALGFVPCFSRQTQARTRSTMYAELVWAAEEFKLRNPAVPWIFPVLLEDCVMPDIGLGNDLTLWDLQWARADEPASVAKLIEALLRLLPATPSVAADILSVNCDPGIAAAGATVALSVVVVTEGGPAVAWLGATFTDVDGRDHHDPNNDVALRLTPGEHSYQRVCRLSRASAPGAMRLTVALWRNKIGDRQIASLDCGEVLTLLGN